MKSESGKELIKLTLPRDYQPGGQGRSAACGNTRPAGPRDDRATEAAFNRRERLALAFILGMVFVAFAWPWLAQLIGGAL